MSGPDSSSAQTSEGTPPIILGGSVRAKSEVDIDQTLLNGRLHSNYRAGVMVGPGFNDVRSGDTPNYLTVTLNSVYAGTTQTLRVKDMTLFADATVAADMLGSRGIAQVGVAGKKWATSAYVAGRITGNQGLYEDNTLRRVGVSAMYRPLKQIQLGVTGQMPIEGDTPLAGAQLMGSAIVNF
jgi:hypothetical protein